MNLFLVPIFIALLAIEAENTDVAKEEMKRGLAEPFTPAVTKGAEY